MTLSQVLEEAVIGDLRKCKSVMIGFGSLRKYFLENKDTLLMLKEKGILKDLYLDDVIEEKIVAEARLYTQMMQRSSSVFADHVARPEFLVYALDNKKLDSRQIKSINLHGENMQAYLKDYRKPDLVIRIREELLNAEPAVLSSVEDFDEHPYD